MKKKRLLLVLLTLLCFIGGARAQSQVFNFEDGQIPVEWTNDATYPWTVVSDAPTGFNGTYCIKSGNGGVGSSSSSIEFTVNFTYDGTISFLGGCWGEGTSTAWDKCIFYIDDVAQLTKGALQSWDTYSYNVTAGEHTFKWSYTKDSSVNPTYDAFFVDDIQISMSAFSKPKNLVVSNVGDQTATISWTAPEGDVTGYVYQYKEALEPEEDFIEASTTATSVTLNGLTPGMDYNFRVKAKYGSNESSFATVDFQTAFCSEEDQCLITLDLTDSYGDGWTNNKIQVVDDETGAILGTYTLTSGGSGSFSLAVCPGREINFVWVLGTYPDEASWVIKDVNDEVITSGTGTTSMATGDVLATYLVDCSVLPSKPTDLATSAMTYNSATLTWTENGTASAWEICLNGNMNGFVVANSNPFTLTGLTEDTKYNVKVRAVVGSERSNWSDAINFTTPEQFPKPADFAVSNITFNSAELSWTGSADNYDVRYGLYPGSTASSWLQYDNGTYVGGVGNSTAGTWTWGAMYPGSLVTGNTLSKVSIYETDYNTEDITINVYSGGDDAPETLLYTETVTPEAANAFHEITLASPVFITPGENLWITLTEYGTYVMAYCQPTVIEPNDQWVYSGGWNNIGDLAPSLAADCWMIRGYMENIDLSSVSWTETSTTESSCQLTGLSESTSYVAQVRANYGTDHSAWNTTGFTTPAANPIPTVTNVETRRTSATIEWTGASDSYKLKYRTTGQEETSYFTDFEHGLPEGWTTIDADGDGYTWVECGEEGIFSAHSGLNCVTSASYDSYNGVALTPDNWLVSPKLTLNGTVKAWLKGQDASYADENFAIYVSTTGTDVTDFTEVLAETTATGNYVQYAADLSSYAGQQGYIAIRHFNVTDMFYLNLDDFGVYTGATTEPGAWTVVATNETSVELTGLTEDTEYEFTVIGVKNGEENAGSALDTFTPRASSLLLYDNGEPNADLINYYNGIVADVTLRNRTLFKDNNWNTICLPFNLTIAGSVLDGATAKTLTNATMTGTTVEFDFGEAVETLQAGVPYIIKWASGENIVNPVFTDVTINKSTTGQTISKADGNVKFIGYYAPFDIDETDEDIFYMTEDNTLMCTGTDRTLKAFRAYFQLSEAATSREFVLNFGDEATGINAPTISVDNDAWYTIDGRKLDKKPVTKGLYIHNGKKFVIK